MRFGKVVLWKGCDNVSASILVIEDDAELCALMRDFFELHGIRVEFRHDGQAGLASALDGGFSLIILDVMLPVLDGFEILRQLRKRSQTPVIMLTARTAHQDRISGLNSGADDYLPKPFDPDELLARVRAVLRRGKNAEATALPAASGALTLDPSTRQARYLEQPLDLTSIEFDILELLVRSAGRIVSRDELTAAVYQRRASPYDRSLDVHVSHVRKKLGAAASIRPIRNVGYLFTAGRDAAS
jgi:two-component system, OmpR family, response regulator CpxR